MLVATTRKPTREIKLRDTIQPTQCPAAARRVLSTGRPPAVHRVAHRPRPTRRVNCISLLLRRESARCASSLMTPACTGPTRPYLEPAGTGRGWSDGSAFRPIDVGPGAAPLGLLNLRPQATGPRSLRPLGRTSSGRAASSGAPGPPLAYVHPGARRLGLSRPPDRRKKTPSRGAARFDPLAVPRSSKKRACATARSGRRSRRSRRSITDESHAA
jgi:hypothetical protein